MALKILLTGAPRSGKSTMAGSVIQKLRARGVRICGIMSPEVRNGARTGFKIIDLASGAERLMSSVRLSSPHRVGKYGVDVGAIDEITHVFTRSIFEADLLVIDEIGKMELFSPRFRAAVEAAFAAEKPLLAVVHRSLAARYGQRGELVHVTIERLEELGQLVLEKLWAVLSRH
jgi:nucleoside-triphosphatase THEP1